MTGYLLETPHCFYFRMRVPHDLQAVLKKREIKKSLKTVNPAYATRLAAAQAVYWHELFSRLRGEKMADITWMVNPRFLRRPDGSVEFSADHIDPDNADNELKLVNGIMNAMGNSAVISGTPVSTTNETILSDAWKLYVDDKGLHWDSKYRKSMTDSFQLIVEIISDKSVSAYTTADRDSLVHTLLKVPTNRNNTKAYSGKPLSRILVDDRSKAISDRTVNGHLSRVIWLFDWLKENQYVVKNVFTGAKLPKTKADNDLREQFQPLELTAIFTDKIFTEHKFERPSQFWLPLIALHSGMRMLEIAQLLVADIITQDDIIAFNVTDVGDEEKSMKTASSRRIVPVHPKLLDLGFRNYVDKIKAQGSERLFPDLPKISGTYSYRSSKDFLTLRRKLKLGKGKDFHSFRHTVATALDRAGLSEAQIAAILGHLGGSLMTGIRYIKSGEIAERHANLCRLSFDDALVKVKPF